MKGVKPILSMFVIIPFVSFPEVVGPFIKAPFRLSPVSHTVSYSMVWNGESNLEINISKAQSHD